MFCYSIGANFGRGTYFSTSFAYSAQDLYSPPGNTGIKHVFLAQVLTGTSAIGAPAMVELPGSTTKRYDTTVDTLQNPQEFVTYNDAHAYLAYLLTFH